MKRFMQVAVMTVVLIGSSMAAFASDVRTDYDHSMNFSQYNTYSWGKVQSSNPFFVARIQHAVDQQLRAKGWKLMPSGGSVTVFATDNVQNQQQVQTMYDGWGGGWADPGFGTSTTTTTDKPVANLVIDLFEGGSKKLLWRGLATEDLSSNAGKNTKKVDNDIKGMFRNFPPTAGK